MSEPNPAESSAPAEAPKSGGMIVKLIALLFIVAVILAECLIAYMYLPSSSSGEAAASDGVAQAEKGEPAGKGEHGKPEHGKSESKKGERAKGHGGKEEGAKKEKEPGKEEHGTKAKKAEHEPAESGGEEGDLSEVDLEQFAVTAHQPTSSTTMRIEFHLFGMVPTINKEEFDRLLKANQHRFREQVLVTLRSAEAPDLSDPGLGLIKRQILAKTNALLGKPLLQAVIVSDFSYIEQ
jgi:flagellar basal body-associated protein FliL